MTRLDYEKGAYYNAAEECTISRPRKGTDAGTSRLILALHGHGGDYQQYICRTQVDNFNIYPHVQKLTDAGFTVMALNYGGTLTWAGPIAMAAITAAADWAQANLGVAPGKIGLMGWSMGGGASFNWLKRNPARVARAWLWTPLASMAWAYSISAYAAEIDTAFGGVYPGPAAGYDPVYDVQHDPTTYRGICPIYMVADPADTTVPWYLNGEAFTNAVGDPLVVAERLPTGGGHMDLFRYISPGRVLSFYDGAW